jgi:hypothetical protein
LKLTLKDWLELEQSARQAQEGLDALKNSLIRKLQATPFGQTTSEEQSLLLKLIQRVEDSEAALSASLYYVQSEWTGGPSADPHNYTLREPNWVSTAHAFPREQVDEFRDPETGEIRLPSRVGS